MTMKVSRICLLFRRHSGEGRNPGEQRRGMKWAAILSVNLPATSQNGLFGCHPRIDGNGLYQPLDSSFRWNDNKGEVKYLLSFRPACGRQARMTMKVSRICLLFRCHSDEGRNPGERRRGVKWAAILSVNLLATGQMVCLVVIPAYTGMNYINHWIPAFAGMTTRAK